MKHPAVLVAWATAAAVIIIDQVTKAWAVAALEGQPDRQIIGDLLRLSFVRNPGAAFGLGGGATIVFSLVAIAVAVVLVRMSTRLVSMWWAVALGLMLGVALGNFIDRLFREPGALQGHVVDFLRLPNFPVFNVADIAIDLGVFMLFVDIFFLSPDEDEETSSEGLTPTAA